MKEVMYNDCINHEIKIEDTSLHIIDLYNYFKDLRVGPFCLLDVSCLHFLNRENKGEYIEK